MSQKRFKQVVDCLLQFISLRLFPAKPEELPLLEKCTWWIPSASKVLSLFSRFPQTQFSPNIFLLIYVFLTILTFRIHCNLKVSASDNDGFVYIFKCVACLPRVEDYQSPSLLCQNYLLAGCNNSASLSFM